MFTNYLFSCQLYNRNVIFHKFIHHSCVLHKIIPNNLKGKSQSSQQWLTRQLNDPYVLRARYENYRARSAFKLIEMDDENQILRPGMIVVECGAAPGSWTQVLVKRLKLDGDDPYKTGAVIAIDILAFHDVPGAVLMPQTDFTKPLNQAKILHVLNDKHVDLLCSDMAPNAIGEKFFDHNAIVALYFSALQFAITVLKPGNGMFLAKLWDGYRMKEVVETTHKFFENVMHLKPPASRGDSLETFIFAKNFKGIKK